MEFCGQAHPETGLTCTRPDGVAHPFHMAGAGATHVEWQNTSFVPPPSRASRSVDRDAIDRGRRKMREVAKGVEPERRSVGVLVDNPRARAEGAEAAMNAVEPEFLSNAVNCATILCMTMERWTADDLWDLLDDQGHYTAHPKAMTGILRKLQGKEFRLIKPVDKDDEDAYRTPRRSNESRLLRVYESMCYDPTASWARPYELRNFD